MQTREITIGSPHGLHMRVASRIAQLSKEHGTEISLLSGDNRTASGSSVLDMLTLGIQHGSTVRVTIEGPAEHLVADQISELLAVGA